GVHGDGEALTLRTDAVLDGHACAVEQHLTGRAAPNAELVLELADLQAEVTLDDEAGDPPVAGVGSGLGEHDVEVADAGVGDPRLDAGQDVGIAVPHGPRVHRRHVRPSLARGQAVGPL